MKTRYLTFQKKLFLYYSILLAAIILIAAILFATFSYQNLMDQSKKNLDQLVIKSSSELDSLFGDMDRIILYIASNPYVNDTLNKAYFDPISDYQIEAEIIKTLTAVTVSNKASRFRINLYNPNGNFISTGVAYSQTVQEAFFHSAQYHTWYDNLPVKKNKASISQFLPDYLSARPTPMVSLYREIYSFHNMQMALGIGEIQCPYSVFHDILAFTDTDFTGYVYNNEGVMLYPDTDTAYGEALYAHYTENNNGIFQNQLYMSNTSKTTGHTLLITMPNTQNVMLIKSMLVLPLFFALITSLLGLFIVYMISKKVTEPLQKLALSVDHVSLSNLSLNVNSDVHMDEISRLNYAFQDMFKRLEQSMEESAKVKEQNMKAHMIALQSQMDPHFLYNMLSIIKAMSRANQTGKIGETADHLSRLLRYNSSFEDRYVPFQKELEHTEHYLALMKLRYEDMFSYHLHIENQDTEIQIPKLSLQPLVENCFQHGFKQKEPPWRIDITFRKEDNHWSLSVTDNGTGISQEAIALLYLNVAEFLQNPSDQLASLKIGGMGLVNTVARFKLTYKENLSFTILALPQGGTKITIGGIDTYEDFAGRG